jgi:hypothetical protein
MATVTLGTAATSTLLAMPFIYGLVPADFATIAAAIKRDTHNPSVPAGSSGPQPPLGLPFSRAGALVIPDRGVLHLFPGDYVAIDATGWPILLSARAAASASWVHT